MIKKPIKNEIRLRKHVRVRKKIRGTPERPRLSVFRSLKNIYAQVIDDTTGNTLVSASTLDEAVKGKLPYGGNKEAAREVGRLVAQRALKRASSRLCLTGAVISTTAGFLNLPRCQAGLGFRNRRMEIAAC